MALKTVRKKTAHTKVSNVTVGNTTVRIYKGSYTSKGRKYDQFTISYREAGKRIRQTFHDHVSCSKQNWNFVCDQN